MVDLTKLRTGSAVFLAAAQLSTASASPLKEQPDSWTPNELIVIHQNLVGGGRDGFAIERTTSTTTADGGKYLEVLHVPNVPFGAAARNLMVAAENGLLDRARLSGNYASFASAHSQAGDLFVMATGPNADMRVKAAFEHEYRAPSQIDYFMSGEEIHFGSVPGSPPRKVVAANVDGAKTQQGGTSVPEVVLPAPLAPAPTLRTLQPLADVEARRPETVKTRALGESSLRY